MIRPQIPEKLRRLGAKAKAEEREKPKAASEPTPENKELQAQRDRLLEKFTVMQADLGGAFYEMAIRDHVRLDVLTRKAAELQRVDAELLAVERLLELERSDAAGLCPSCGSPYGPAVRFCPQCGHSLTPIEAAPENGAQPASEVAA
jgi:zinc-ribbon domain